MNKSTITMEDRYKIEVVDAWYVKFSDNEIVKTKDMQILEKGYDIPRHWVLGEEGWDKVDADEVVYNEDEVQQMKFRYTKKWIDSYTRWGTEYLEKAKQLSNGTKETENKEGS